MPAVTIEDTSGLPRLPVVPTDARQRSIRSVTTAPGGFEGEGFPVRRAFAGVDLAALDPFVHLDQIGEVDYAPGDPKGTPWHPHRGFETVTYMMDGVLQHADSIGGGGVIRDGGTQWMTAGKGILHIETPPSDVVAAGGWFHGLQLWVNLPRERKWVDPRYQDLDGDLVGLVTTPAADSLLRLIAGELGGHRGPGSTNSPMSMVHASLAPGAQAVVPWPAEFNCLAYVLGGSARIGRERRPVSTGQLTVFGPGEAFTLEADARQDTRTGTLEMLFLGGLPIREPVAWYGPFVMNTKAEIQQAFDDFEAGKLGTVPRQHPLAPTDEVAVETDSPLD
ncbi:MAG: Pirin [uncultured Acidimicrobiales bacterium]|uniref:Pirin n=1 Tax=uncultured Acidimicrobiales bacterium TaxID=310071 RepID=A0A6J4HJE9_9ACTN|nr:MAG: Pirin [uncultured Acidimicrobiales bacterium]